MRILGWLSGEMAKKIVKNNVEQSHSKIVGKVLGKAAGAVAEKATSTVVGRVEDKAVEKFGPAASEKIGKMMKQHTEADLLAQNPNNFRLITRQSTPARKSKFDVYNEFGNKKYSVKGKTLSKHYLRLIDSNGSELGLVKKKLIALRSPFSFQFYARDYIIEINGDRLGQVKTHRKGTKRRCQVDFNGWSVEGDFFESNYTVHKGETLIARISRTTSCDEETFVLDFSDPANELVILFLVAALHDTRNSRN